MKWSFVEISYFENRLLTHQHFFFHFSNSIWILIIFPINAWGKKHVKISKIINQTCSSDKYFRRLWGVNFSFENPVYTKDKPILLITPYLFKTCSKTVATLRLYREIISHRRKTSSYLRFHLHSCKPNYSLTRLIQRTYFSFVK